MAAKVTAAPTLAALGCGLLLLVIIGWSSTSADSQTFAGRETASGSGERPRLFRLLDFERFKRVFNKKYGSLVEEMSRMRIFLSKCLRSFVSILKYKQHHWPSYKSVNSFSDRTRAEIRRLFMRFKQRLAADKSAPRPAPSGPSEPLAASQEADLEGLNIASEAEAERKMVEIVRQQRDLERDSSVREIADTPSARRKRDLSKTAGADDERQLGGDVADLMGGLLARIDRIEQLEREPPLLLARPAHWDHLSQKLQSAEQQDHDHHSNRKGPAGVALPRADQANKTARALVRPADEVLTTDLRHCLNEPYYQGDCASCYVFTAMALLEWHYCNRHNGQQREKFSKQFPLDCNLDSCDGGWADQVIEFSLRHGLERDQEYPYFGRHHKCPFGKAFNQTNEPSGYWTLAGLEWERIHYEHLGEALEQSGPVAVQLSVTDEFADYGGGVDQLLGCNTDHLENQHVMVLVARGRQQGHDFWLLRNSYAASWGEEGDYKISTEALERCFVDATRVRGQQARFRRNRLYDSELMAKRAAKWQQQLAAKQKKQPTADAA